MTPLDLTAIVESVAREMFLAHPLSDKSMVDAGWDLYESDAQAAVTVTLRALAPLADEWKERSDVHAAEGVRLADLAEIEAEKGNFPESIARSAESSIAYRGAAVVLACAIELRALIGGAK